ncbi:sensor histidine kinase [Spirillospora sp. NBC_01491]|uniref:sensor histidine kinase n=1 Tax=Spirillospora sp. NBC_01491 TaxID=2976007 RepID=UPI002E350EFD|nr:histidine kinase [Spirillospora sp. NBC_01491]
MTDSADRPGVLRAGARTATRGTARGAARAAAGVLLGALTAAAALVLLPFAALLVACATASSRGRRAIPRPVADGARALTGLEHRRLARFHGERGDVEYGPPRALAYLLLRMPLGLLGGAILLLIGYGAALGARLAAGWWITGRYLDGIPPAWWIVVYTVVAGAVLLFLAVAGLAGVVMLERRAARRCLGPSPLAEYERRIAQLSVSRAEVVDAVDDERRRIERDLHDGVQQRLVALGMLIGRARRAGDGDRAGELLRQAHEESRRALEDLREVTWRVYPSALDGEGLRAALETVAERSPLPVTIDYGLTGRPPHAVEIAAYFVVCEAVTNAVKHSGATRVRVEVTAPTTPTTPTGHAGPGPERERMITVRIEDDGTGDADPGGGGLAGLARRAAALDGTFAVRSPSGGPTVIIARLPCG